MAAEPVNERTPWTIIVAPRERFDRAVASLDSIIEHTDIPFRLVYLEGGASRRTKRELARRCRTHGFVYRDLPSTTTPNNACRIGFAEVDTPWVVFADNDLIVESGWLRALLACGDETGADAVTPLLFQGRSTEREIHIAGGYLEWSGDRPNRTFVDEHRHQGRRLPELDGLEREPCDFVEFHCCLVRSAAIEAMGGLDEGLRNSREHLDLSLSITERGGEIWFEPGSWARYDSPTRIALRDIPYYCRRWSDARASISVQHFCEKWGIHPAYAANYETRSRRDIVIKPVVEAVRHRAGNRAADLTRQVLRSIEHRVGRIAFASEQRDAPKKLVS